MTNRSATLTHIGRLFLALSAFLLFSAAHAQESNSEFLTEIERLENQLDGIEGDDLEDGFEALLLNEKVSVAHHEYGVFLSREGDIASATRHFRRAYKLDRENLGTSDPIVAKSANSLATNLNFLGRYGEAESLLREILVTAEADSSGERLQRWTVINTLAGSLTGQNRLREAERLLRETRMQIDEATNSRHGTLSALIDNNLAHNLFQQRRFSEAASLFLKVVEFQRKEDDLDSSEGLLARHNLASTLLKTGVYDEALLLAKRVYDRRVQQLGSDHPDSLTSQMTLGLALRGTGALSDAIATLESALTGKIRKLGNSHPDTIESATELVAALLDDPERTAEAYAYAAPTAAIVRERLEAAGTGVGDLAQYARDLENSKELHRLLLEAAWHSKDKDRISQAFEAAQTILNGTTSRAVAEKAADRAAGRAGLRSITERRKSLSEEWNRTDQSFLTLVASTEPGVGDELALVANQRRDLVAKIEQIDAQIGEAAPDYFALIKPATLTVTDARSILRPDEAALMIIPMANATHLLLITSDDVVWRRSKWRSFEINQAVERLLWDVGASVDVPIDKSLQWREEGKGVYPYDFKTAKALHDELIRPIEPAIADKKVLFIAASGKLSTMPFGILVSEVPAGRSGDPKTLRSAKWFADDIAQIYIPSIQSLQFLRTFRKDVPRSNKKSFLGFGDPVLEGKSQTRGAKRGSVSADRSHTVRADIFDQLTGSNVVIADPKALSKMSRLPGTATELKAIWIALGKPEQSLFLAEAATETQVREIILDADIISFATHGLLAGEIGGLVEPGLVLSPPEKASLDDDGYLSSSEIAALDISSDWVILSACNTAGGDGNEGEGFSGLAKSFFFAGAPSLLASHWPVRDQVAADMTVAAVQFLRDNSMMSPAESLQLAMQQIRNDTRYDTANDTWAHPNAWAPFTLVGDR